MESGILLNQFKIGQTGHFIFRTLHIGTPATGVGSRHTRIRVGSAALHTVNILHVNQFRYSENSLLPLLLIFNYMYISDLSWFGLVVVRFFFKYKFKQNAKLNRFFPHFDSSAAHNREQKVHKMEIQSNSFSIKTNSCIAILILKQQKQQR